MATSGILASPRPAPLFAAVHRDEEGVRLALREMLEESFQVARVTGSAMTAETREKHVARIEAGRKMTPGYYRWSNHLFRLDAERSAGIPLEADNLTAAEANGLRMLALARQEYRAAHPPCGRCGTEQESRFHPQCTHCGAKFARKGA